MCRTGNAFRAERQIELLARRQDPTWIGALSQWWQATACMRLKHLQSSSPQMLTGLVLRGHCHRGKQQNRKMGSNFAIPSHFTTGWESTAWMSGDAAQAATRSRSAWSSVQ